MDKKVGVGLIGSQFISSIHADALSRVADAEIIAVMSPTKGHAKSFAERFHIPNHFTDLDDMLAMPGIDMVVIGAPNYLHCEITLKIAKAGKHVVVEKPLCMNLEEADLMIEACKQANVKLMYAEELCFAPKYVRMKALLDEGALGKPTLFKQSEKHDGPHADHFWDVERSGGGVTMDMGCHAIQFFRWLHPGRAIKSVYAQMMTSVHTDKTKGEDNSIVIMEFDDGVVGMMEESWTKLGGMDDKAEIHGTEGVAYADLLQGNSIQTYSTKGIGYAVEKAGNTIGWSYTMYEESWNYGFPQEFEHFVDCVKNDKQPLVTGEDGKAVLEVIYAAYESAGTGRKVMLPFRPNVDKPYKLWKK
ncbi:Gfo/Idh/MocA family protein [Flagellimonas pelagia]|uniref:Gfo/Idh/MocA family oxidoreductase n=1 Tax=Flagellimonas pelagia TaxID=2306998 RepID=A0A3A1NFG1_9FLAO|nr:Gfo/Idh/MocA family oxidoreductase [Allomuricauda maritima]RIV43460.1 gfo/Idh/MocA family oxidoreductase [Allomuricauda maritima]TXJ92800.1 Gfo/Idh/MocA family oxidoreductase [Allomuricauda maritima]